jgi:beta-glucosidase
MGEPIRETAAPRKLEHLPGPPNGRAVHRRRLVAAGLVIALSLIGLAVVFGPNYPRRVHRLLFLLHRQQARGAVVFLGDSIFARWNGLDKAFSPLRVANRGLGGDRTEDILRRLEFDVISLQPSALVLLAGTNDLRGGNPPETVLANIRLIISRLRDRFPDLPVVVCKLTPRESLPGLFPERIVALNGAIDRTFRDLPHTRVCDLWTVFADNQGCARPDEFPDLLHPNPAAYARLTALLKPLLEEMLLSDSGPTR